MAKIIAFTNQAGGVGKSTSVVNIAAFLSKNYNVLVVDADGQQTATMNLGINPPAVARKIKMALAWLCRVRTMYSASCRVFVFCI